MATKAPWLAKVVLGSAGGFTGIGTDEGLRLLAEGGSLDEAIEGGIEMGKVGAVFGAGIPGIAPVISRIGGKVMKGPIGGLIKQLAKEDETFVEMSQKIDAGENLVIEDVNLDGHLDIILKGKWLTSNQTDGKASTKFRTSKTELVEFKFAYNPTKEYFLLMN